MIYSRKTLLTAFFALLLVKSAFAANAILNHTATLGANGFACDNGKLYVASSGGLYCRNQLTGVGTLFNNSAVFPDPALTAIALDASGVLWMGSQNGYLYKREKNGLQIVVTAYAAAGWPITSIMAYGRYIIIGSEKGCSVLDAAKLVVLKNATEFSATVPGSRVNAITVFRDTLLLGCDLGVVKLYAAGSRLSDANFYDPSIWSIDSSMSRPVRAFTVRASGYRVFDTPGAMLGESIFTGRPEGDSSALFINGNRSLGLSSRVTCMTIDSIRKTCLIGTKLHYFYEWDGTHLLSDNIQGPTFTTVLRVFVDHRSDLWACPEIGAGTTNPWWEGISVYTNNAWTLHSPLNSPGMGSITGNNIFRGVAEDRMGNMWFGTPFGGVKRYDREKKSWSQYSVSERSNGPQFVKAGNVAYRGKCDAVARDSAGFLWMASWENYSGCLIGYDPDFEPVPSATTPQTRHYKRFWPQEHPYYSENITCLNVDKANNIFAGSDQNKLVIFSYSDSPLINEPVYKEFVTGIGAVIDAVSTPDGLTRIVTSKGVYTYFPKISDNRDTLVQGLAVFGNDGYSLAPQSGVMVIDSTLTDLTAIEAEDEQILWFGTATKGLIRYDLNTRTRSVIDQTAGLLSNAITDLSTDHSKSYLWIGSDRGVSRYTIGYSLGKKNSADMAAVYPDPYSKRRHRQLFFQNFPPQSTVEIYTVSGTFIASLSPDVRSQFGASFTWLVPSRLVPGIYTYSVRSGTKSSLGKFIVTP